MTVRAPWSSPKRWAEEPSQINPLCAAELGFSLHAATTARADDVEGREALVRYILRPDKCDRGGGRLKLRALVLAVPSIDRRAS